MSGSRGDHLTSLACLYTAVFMLIKEAPDCAPLGSPVFAGHLTC